MESTSFYMTLPSSTRNSDEMYPDNSASSFRIQLPKTIHLKNKYEVALVEIIYPHTWATFHHESDYKLSFIYNDPHAPTEPALSADIKIARGYYRSPEELCREINQSFKNKFEGKPFASLLRFSFNNITHKVRLKIDMDGKGVLKLSPGLTDVLGFKPGVFMDSIIAPYKADINRGFYNLYIYCNICEAQIVGDAYVPLLRTVFITGKHGDMVQQIFQEPHYVPVNINSFDTIEIHIKNDMNETISFESGKVICKLHFRQKAL